MSHCNDKPIRLDTSLPTNGSLPAPSGGLTAFDINCRELAECMCKAVVRSIEQYRVEMIEKYSSKADDPELPTLLAAWKNWAKTTMVGLPDCLDPDAVSVVFTESMQVDVAGLNGATLLNAKYANRTYDAVQAFGSHLISFNIDDWHDE